MRSIHYRSMLKGKKEAPTHKNNTVWTILSVLAFGMLVTISTCNISLEQSEEGKPLIMHSVYCTIFDITIEKSEEMGLTLNVKKTECMVISKKAIVPSCNLQSRGQQIKLVKKFKYLGYMITSDGKCITEIKKRIATAKDAFQKLSLILKNRNISMTTKFRVLKTSVWSTLTYGCECWTITSDIEKKIEAAEMWFIRRMLRISWAVKKTNVNVLREGNVQRSLLKTIRKRQMEFLGHVCRRRGLEFLSLTGKVEGKRDRGKQRITFLDSLCNSATGGQSKGLHFLKLSDDRDVWRGMVANVCSRSGTWWWWWYCTNRLKMPKTASLQAVVAKQNKNAICIKRLRFVLSEGKERIVVVFFDLFCHCSLRHYRYSRYSQPLSLLLSMLFTIKRLLFSDLFNLHNLEENIVLISIQKLRFCTGNI